MLKARKFTLVLLAVTIVFSFTLSEAFAQQDCTVSTLQDDWQYPPDWCGEINISGPATVNPGTNWVGTIEPADLDATCSVSSNSGCTIECYLIAEGNEVVVPLEPNHCGSFIVTITQPASGGCPEGSATKAVRINNAGQGGAWEEIDYCNGDCSGWDTSYCGGGGLPLGSLVDNDGYAWYFANCRCYQNPPGTQCDDAFIQKQCFSCPPAGWEGKRDYFCCQHIWKYEWKCNTCE